MTMIHFNGLVLINESRELKGGKENKIFKRIMKGTTESGAALDLVISEDQFKLLAGRDGMYAEVAGRVGVDYKSNIEFLCDDLVVRTKLEALQIQMEAEKALTAKPAGNGDKKAS